MQVPDIGRQWFSVTSLDKSLYSEQIALSRTFCTYEEVSTIYYTSPAITFCLLLKYNIVATC